MTQVGPSLSFFPPQSNQGSSGSFLGACNVFPNFRNPWSCVRAPKKLYAPFKSVFPFLFPSVVAAFQFFLERPYSRTGLSFAYLLISVHRCIFSGVLVSFASIGYALPLLTLVGRITALDEVWYVAL